MWTTTETVAGPYIREIEAEFARFGYVPGKNITLVHRYTDAVPERLPVIAAEVVAAQPDVVMAALNTSAVALRKLSTTIPIVVGNSIDPVATGLAESIARPGRNVSGMMSAPAEVMDKRLQILREIVPKASRIGVVWNRASPGVGPHLAALAQAAAAFGAVLIEAPMDRADDLDRVFDDLKRERADALMGLTTDNLTFLLRQQIGERALRDKLPSVFGEIQFCQSGALACYSANLSALFPRSVKFVDRILKGARPGELPFELPVTYELAFNLSTARTLGVEVSLPLQAGADQLFE